MMMSPRECQNMSEGNCVSVVFSFCCMKSWLDRLNVASGFVVHDPFHVGRVFSEPKNQQDHKKSILQTN
jgi:hypothetical protein